MRGHNVPVVLLLIFVVKCLAMSHNELEDFADYLKKTSQLSPTLKKGVEPDEDEDEVVSDHAWEESGKFEGDLILNERQRRLIVENVAEGLSRNGISDGSKRWPNNEVIYYIQVEHFTSDQVQAIKSGIDDLAQASCIKFRPYRKGDRDAVVIQGNRRGCFSQVGYQGGYQVLNLFGRHPVGRGCFRHGTVIHEMLHTLGFYHMQSSPDRDDYVDIVWNNIIKPARHNFRKYNAFSVSDFGVGYDYDSVLHYSRRAFSSNGKDTIVPKKSGADIGQRLGLSDKDTQKLNKMYCDGDSDHVAADENSEKKVKKNTKNKPFDGHGIGYHQGKAVVIKLSPTAETFKIAGVPSIHVFDYFSKTPQILSTPESENFRIGKEIAYSYKPPVHSIMQEYKEPSYDRPTYYNEKNTNSDVQHFTPDRSHAKEESPARNNKSSETEKNNDDESNQSLFSPDSSIIETFDRLTDIIKSRVYPSQTPDLSIYKPYEQIKIKSSPEEVKEERELIITTLLNDEKPQPAHFESTLQFRNNQDSLDTFKKIQQPKEYDYEKGNKKTAVVTMSENKNKYRKYTDPSYAAYSGDNFDLSKPYNRYEKYILQLNDEENSHENNEDWHKKYTAISKPTEYEGYQSYLPHSMAPYDDDYGSSIPYRIQDYPYPHHDTYSGAYIVVKDR